VNKILWHIVGLGSRVERRHVQLALALVTLVVLVLGVGAPVDGGGPSGAKVGSGDWFLLGR